MMQKIRSNAGLLIVTIGVAMVAFILTDLFKSLNPNGDKRDIGEVYGKPVNYDAFYALYQQNLSNQTANTDEERTAIAQSTWEGYVNQLIFEREYKSAGVDVPGDELFSLFLNPPPNSVIRTIASFKDSTGRFNQAYVRQALNMMEMDPQDIQSQQQADFIDFMKSLEEYIYQNRLRDKYFGLVKNGTFVSSNEARRQYANENRKADISYVAVNYSVIPDDQVTVTDADLKAYLNEHREEYRKENEVTLRYVKFLKTPSKEDTAASVTGINKMLTAWNMGETDTAFNDTTFLVNYNGRWDSNFVALNNLPLELGRQIDNPTKGKLYGPILDGGNFNVFKIMNTREGKDEYVRLRHILIKVKGFEKADTTAAEKAAKDLLKDVNADNFAQMASEKSEDQTTSKKGGYLGWLGSSTGFGPKFDKDVAKAKVGERFVAKSDQGFHIVELQARTNKKLNVASVRKEIYAGTNTLKTIFKEASRFAGKAIAKGSLDEASMDSPGINVAVTKPALTSSSTTISGLEGARPVIRWALAQEESNLISESILETENAYVVAQVGEISQKGYQTLEDVREQITTPVLNQKKAEMIMEKLNGISSTNLDEIVTAYGQGAYKQSASGISFNSSSIPVIGSDPYIIGKISAMQLNQVSAPLKGMSGVYVIKIDNITEAPEMQQTDVETRKMTIGFQKKSGVENKIFQGLREIADVKDYRHKFEL
ncbi:MAG: peptidyl-prolyl cis-trans isomerase [Bacteroidia bacterium]|nr:peptidyl-prolyl cis-trans isomerase [Bacteroidia bacterium]